MAMTYFQKERNNKHLLKGTEKSFVLNNSWLKGD